MKMIYRAKEMKFKKFIGDLKVTRPLIRNVALVGHLHHGKTTFVDCLLRQIHPKFDTMEEKSIRYTNTLFTEQEKGVSIKAVPSTLVLQDVKHKSYFMNVSHTPNLYHKKYHKLFYFVVRFLGYVNFLNEVTDLQQQFKWLMVFEFLLRQAAEGLILNTKVHKECDRIFSNLKLPPSPDVCIKLRHIVDEVNSLLSVYSKQEDALVSPIIGNVCFANCAWNLSRVGLYPKFNFFS